VPGGIFFFTMVLLERRRRLLTEHIGLLRRCFADARRTLPFQVNATSGMLPPYASSAKR